MLTKGSPPNVGRYALGTIYYVHICPQGSMLSSSVIKRLNVFFRKQLQTLPTNHGANFFFYYYYFCELEEKKRRVDSPLPSCLIPSACALLQIWEAVWYLFVTKQAGDSLPTYRLLCPSTLPSAFLMVLWRLKFFWTSTGPDISMELKFLTAFWANVVWSDIPTAAYHKRITIIPIYLQNNSCSKVKGILLLNSREAYLRKSRI